MSGSQWAQGGGYWPAAQVTPPGQPVQPTPLAQALMGHPPPMQQLPPIGGGVNGPMMQMLMQDQDKGRPLGAPTTVGSNQPGYPSTDALMNAPSGMGGILPASPQAQGIRGQLSDFFGNLNAPSGTASYNTATPVAQDPSFFARLQSLFGQGRG